MAIAIDFGTSNTVITRWNAATETAEIVRLPGITQELGDNPPLIPSLVYVENGSEGKVIVGQTVRDRGLDLSNNPRCFRSFKRGIGAEIQGFLPELDGKIVTFELVGQWFLTALIEQLKATIDTPDSLVLTVPVDSFENYRLWLSEVCQSFSVEQIRMLDEPTAAALGYETTTEKLLLVLDFGGGTVDFSLVQLDRSNTQGLILKWGEKLLGKSAAQKAKTARVLAKAGQNLGGADLDNWLTDYLAKNQGLPPSPLINRLAERLKIKLSSERAATEVYFDDETLETYELKLDREGFEEILRTNQFFAQLDELMTQVLQQGRRNGIEKEDIDAVLLVGGTVQIPAVKNWVLQYFEAEKIRSDRPLTAIAQGALQLTQGIEVKDFLYHSYGIRYWNPRKNAHSWHKIINSGQPLPLSNPIELLLGASRENQPSMELVMGELGAETAQTEVYFDGDRLVTRNLEKEETPVKTLNDRDGARTIATLNPPGNPGSDRLKIQFWVDEQRNLRITIEDLLTQETLLNNQIVAKLS
ncbi:MAG: Hsp70 family protein [Gomphosphaeria aponina SAG 52.96 = DSM 107014]|uniref:Hsp70 family protein n=1 Tax=Gomphosphaeria aponina SAG 52.96 = DSM 107014 TaxID=1521640 RepID=A0A941GT88_9CHRO|nr:Hsp70 family protein [Gomphosphaeria aponina SAG 52.96 = DSM 107014]